MQPCCVEAGRVQDHLQRRRSFARHLGAFGFNPLLEGLEGSLHVSLVEARSSGSHHTRPDSNAGRLKTARREIQIIYRSHRHQDAHWPGDVVNDRRACRVSTLMLRALLIQSRSAVKGRAERYLQVIQSIDRSIGIESESHDPTSRSCLRKWNFTSAPTAPPQRSSEGHSVGFRSHLRWAGRTDRLQTP